MMVFESTLHSFSNLHKVISVVRALFLPLDYLYLLDHSHIILNSARILLDLASRVACITHNLLLSLRHVLYTAPLSCSSYLLLEISRCTVFRLVLVSACLRHLYLLLLLFEERGTLMRLVPSRFDRSEGGCVGSWTGL